MTVPTNVPIETSTIRNGIIVPKTDVQDGSAVLIFAYQMFDIWCTLTVVQVYMLVPR